jgi:hypothetical protein
MMTTPHVAVLTGWTNIISIGQFLCPIELLWIPLVYLVYNTMETDIISFPIPVIFTPMACLALLCMPCNLWIKLMPLVASAASLF